MMYDEFDDYAYDDDSLMEEIDDILYDEEYERTLYEVNVCEINDYWDRENEYIRSSGIYSDDEVEQILENHNRIRDEKIAEATEDYERELEWIREQKEWAAQERQWERENREYERLMALEEAEEARLDSYFHNIGSRDYTPKQSLASRLLTGAAIYHFLKKLF